MDKKYKMLIPNYLTLTRIILTPFIIIFGLLHFIWVVAVLAGLAAITDFFDGYLARKWNAVSKKGAKFGVKEIDGIFDFHVGSFFERQAHSMHSVKLNNITDRAEKQSSLKFLANQLGTANYAAFQKTSDLAGVF